MPAKTQAGSPTTKDRIIETTAEHFRRYGYNGTGLKQIVAEAGAQLGSLYHFFPGGKTELAEETIRHSGAMYGELVELVFDAAPDVITGAGDVYRAAAAVLEETDYADACPIATVALEVASTDDTLREATAVVFEDWIARATRRLHSAGIPEDGARRTAIVLIALLEGAFVLSRAVKSTEPLEAAADAARAAVAAELKR